MTLQELQSLVHDFLAQMGGGMSTEYTLAQFVNWYAEKIRKEAQ